MLCQLQLIIQVLSCSAAGVMHMVDPSAPNSLQACVASGADACTLLPGTHVVTSPVVIGRGGRSVHVVGRPGALLTGAAPLTDVQWQNHRGAIWKTTVPAALRKAGGFEQLWATRGGEYTWLPEARWPNANLSAGGAATLQGGPLSMSSWATTFGRVNQTDNDTDCTRLRKGEIVDPALASTGIDFSGALATLEAGLAMFL